MLLQNFLSDFEESRAQQAVSDYLREETDGPARAEFMGHFLNSVFQPVFELSSNQLQTVGFEAYLRPVAGDTQIAPAHYFKNLKASDQSFTDKLCRELHVTNFLKQSKSKEFLSVNLTRQTLVEHQHSTEHLVNEIAQLYSLNPNMPLQPKQLNAEINLAPDLDAGLIFSFANQLRRSNIALTLEGFDADCASFSRIVQNKPDVVKFNRTWLDADIFDENYVGLVASTVSAVQAVGAKAHLEQIETEHELTFAIACGFDRFQGYHLGSSYAVLQRDNIALKF